MKKQIGRKIVIGLIQSLIVTGCGKEMAPATGDSINAVPAPSEAAGCTDTKLSQLESKIRSTLSTVESDVDFALQIRTEDGRELTFNRGAATMTTLYESASTSKFISATAILNYMETAENLASARPLTLDSRPQDFLSSSVWPIDSTSPLYNITLRHLLSFTSGLVIEPVCTNSPLADFEKCITAIALANAPLANIPGAEFYYGSNHLQVAGLMAVKARNFSKRILNSTWQNFFDDFKVRTGLFPNSQFDLPSKMNPRLAGGMHWTGSDYLEFIKAYYSGGILSEALRLQQLSDQITEARIANSPADRVGEDWHYGLGIWLECRSSVFNCAQGAASYSSPGSYGAYPFMNLQNKFYGMMARQGELNSFPNAYAVYSAVEADLIKWATKTCDDGEILEK